MDDKRHSLSDGDAKHKGRTVTCHMGFFTTTIGVRQGGSAAEKKENGSQKEHPAFQSGGWRIHSSTAF